jgi:hypothetical protein
MKTITAITANTARELVDSYDPASSNKMKKINSIIYNSATHGFDYMFCDFKLNSKDIKYLEDKGYKIIEVFGGSFKISWNTIKD